MESQHELSMAADLPWLALFGGISLLSILLEATESFFLFGFAKPVPIAMLINLLFTSCYDETQTVFWKGMFVGLCLALVGDICLLKGSIKNWFLAGLVSFLIGHLCYIASFAHGVPFIISGGWCFFIAIACILYGLLLSAMMFNRHKGEYVPPCMVYLMVITVMTITAVNFDLVTKPAIPFISIGSVLFFTSDSFICWHKFIHPIPTALAPFAILGTYYPAQACIIMGSVQFLHASHMNLLADLIDT